MTYSDFLDYLYDQIPRSPHQAFSAGEGLARVKAILHYLDDPQEKLKVIHLAGTSGKGSTAYAITQLLHSAGFAVGLHLSPHVSDVKERFQVWNGDQRFPADDAVVDSFEKVKVAIDAAKEVYGQATYFELLTILCFQLFYDQSVDYAVIETGLGGTYDATNCVMNQSKICVLTPIDYDHMHILGNSIEEIAGQKAGIIQPHQLAISAQQKEAVVGVFQRRADAQDAKLVFSQTPVEVAKIDTEGMFLNYEGTMYQTKLLGQHQAQNLELALETVTVLADRDGWELSREVIGEALQRLKIPARFEIMQQSPLIIADVAHNPHKMRATVETLKQIGIDKLTVIAAFKYNKDVTETVKELSTVAKEIVFTSFSVTNQDFYPEPANTEYLVQVAEKFGILARVITDPHQAVREILESQQPLLVTGSFYLVAEVYEELKHL